MTPESDADVVRIDPWRRRDGAMVRAVAPVPADKSLTHRALIMAGLARGHSVIRNPLMSKDCLATMEALKPFGVRFALSPHSPSAHNAPFWEVDSPGADAFVNPGEVLLDLGNSGTSARLLMGVFAGLPGLKVTLTGDHSLTRRPMARVTEPLCSMGASIKPLNESARLPLTITGSHLRAVTHHISVASAQIKSALLLAGLRADGETIITLPAGGRDHTERMLSSLGALIERQSGNGFETLRIQGPYSPPPFEFTVPGDPSSLAFFAAMAALHPGLEIAATHVLYNPTRIGFFPALERMGVTVRWREPRDPAGSLGERVADAVIFRDNGIDARPVEIQADDVVTMIDEIPVLAVIAAMTEGVTVIHGLGELRHKESDRLAEVQKLLTAAGRRVESAGDTLVIYGQSGYCQGFEYAGDDHRLLMSAIVLATRANAPSRVRGVSWIETSFPLFLEGFQNINAGFMSV